MWYGLRGTGSEVLGREDERGEDLEASLTDLRASEQDELRFARFVDKLTDYA